jgi:hypothetical protein
MIIDAHNHVKWLGYTPEKIIENMDQNRPFPDRFAAGYYPIPLGTGKYLETYYPGGPVVPGGVDE